MKAEDGMCSLVPTGHCVQIIKGLEVAKENVSYSIILSINKQGAASGSRIDPNEHCSNSQSPS